MHGVGGGRCSAGSRVGRPAGRDDATVNEHPAASRLAAAAGLPAGRPALTLVLPTFNESGNLAEAIRRVGQVLAGVDWEVIVVDDDSPDGTSALAKSIAVENPRVRCIRRVGRRGLAGACIEGMLASSAPVVAVMDADLQHDEALLPQMYALIAGGEADVAVGSRFVAGSEVKGLSRLREFASTVANETARRMLGVTLADPMSGFFMLRREIVDAAAPKLANQGFKILLDILSVSPRTLKVHELPFTFRDRVAGESKLDSLMMLEFLGLLVSRYLGGALPVRFFMFALVGLTGVVVHLISLRVGITVGRLAFNEAQLIATFVAMTWNFFLNNRLTYSDRRLRGFWGLTRGLITFYLVCSVGVVGNVGIAGWLNSLDQTWWIAGTAGALVGAVWNFSATAMLTWRVH